MAWIRLIASRQLPRPDRLLTSPLKNSVKLNVEDSFLTIGYTSHSSRVRQEQDSNSVSVAFTKSTAEDDMVALPAVKFLFLGIRQLTKPITKQIVSRATSKHGITYSVCIGLGRVSLGMSGVIGEWSRKEELKRLENKRKAEEAEKKKAAETAMQAAQQAVSAPTAPVAPEGAEPLSEDTKRIMKEALSVADGGAAPAAATPAQPSPSGETKTQEPAVAPEKQHVISLPSIATPRSRSLLEPIMYGPKPQVEQSYDTTVFVDPAKRTPGAVMSVFIRHPYRSVWYVFKTAFLAPFPEKRLVDAGADFLIELIAYTILATLLFIELRQASRAAAAKEERVNARLDAIEEKINELVRVSEGAARSNVEELPPVPELKIKGRLDSLAYVAKASYKLAESLLVDPLVVLTGATHNDASATHKHKSAELSEEERAAVALIYDKNSRIPKAPPPDPRVKHSKHDESAAMKAELAKALGSESKIPNQ